MKKLFLIILGLFITVNVYGFEIVYPKTKNVVKNSPTTFFIGSSITPLKINGQSVKLHSTGGFAHFVKLPDSVNTFVIESNNQKEIYTIKRTYGKKAVQPKISEFKNEKYFIIIKNKAPLRTTPVGAGINRMAHLQEGVLLTIDGEKGNFYRVKLDDNKKAWIGKDYVKETTPFKKAKLKKYDFTENKNDYILTFHLDKKIPYEIKEGHAFEIRFFNTEKEELFKFPYEAKTGSDKLFGYYGEYKDNDFILKIRKPPKINKNRPLEGIKIVVDPGHGGKENGATGCLGDKEKNIVLKISKYLEEELKSKGADVLMTREDDVYVGLNERVDYTNNSDAVIFVSIHNNALPDTMNPNEHRGTSIFYYYNQSKPLAETVLKTMTEELKTNNDNIHQQSFAVVRNTGALSILIEVAYLINPDDNALLINSDFQKNAAKAIADGIEEYLK